MPWRPREGGTYNAWVRPVVGPRRVCSTGTRDLAQAKAIERWCVELRERGDRLGVLGAIAERRIALRDAYHLGERAAAAQLDAAVRCAADIDLVPLLEQWVAWRLERASGTASVARYRTQIRVLFPETPWRRSSLTPPQIALRLDDLRVADPTRNRYRAALSAFCRWLVRRGTLESNPVRAIGGYAEHRARVTWYTVEDAQRVVAALPVAWRAREALMVGTGMDWSDCARLRVRDVDWAARMVRCHGYKTPWRNRVVRITEAWTLPYLAPALAGKLPDALVCEGSHDTALDQHHRAVAVCRLPHSTLHDWRHTYAVTALRRGESVQVVAHQLGHANPYLVFTRYGKYVPSLQDYQAQPVANDLANTSSVPRRTARG